MNAIERLSGIVSLYDAAVVAYKPVYWVCERSETISDIHDGWVRCWTTGAPW